MAGVYKKGMLYYVSSDVREATYGAEAAASRKILLARPRPVKYEVDKAYNGDMANGVEGDSASTVRAQWWSWTPEIGWPKADDLAMWLAYTLGPSTPSAADGVAYKHVFTPDTTFTLPSFSLTEDWDAGATAGLRNRYSGGLVESLNISWERNQPIRISPSCVFANCQADTLGTVNFTAETAVLGQTGVHAYYGASVESPYAAALGSCDLATSTDISARIRSLDLTITNIGTRAMLWDGRSNVPGLSVRGARSYRMRIVLEVEGRTELAYIGDGAEKAFEIGIDSGVVAGSTTQNYGAQIIVPRAQFTAYEDSFGDRTQMLQAFDVQIMEDATYGRILPIVWNKTAAYAAAS